MNTAPTTQAAFDLWHRIDSGAWLFNAVNRLTPRMAYLLATLALALISAADYSTHIELMLSPFYAIPCFLVDWRIGRTQALVYAVFASAVQWFVGTFGGHAYSHAFYLYWDIGLNLAFYGVLIWMVAKLRLALEMEQALSRMDFLTRLDNRKSFLEGLDARLLQARANSVASDPIALGVLSVQIDRFAAFNQEQGYTVGDLVLGAVADIMRRAARKEELSGRTDNAEFSIAFLGASEAALQSRMRSVGRQMEMLMMARGWRCTFSIGAARFVVAPESAAAAMGKLRVLLEEARMAGKNRSLLRAWDAQGQVIGGHKPAGPTMDFEQTSQMYVDPGHKP